MNVTFPLFVITLLLCFQAKGQTFIGVKSGVGVSYLKSGFNKPYHKIGFSDPIISYSLAGCISKSFSNRFDGNIEIQVARKGYAYRINNYFQLNRIKAYRTSNTVSFNMGIGLALVNIQKEKRFCSFYLTNGAYASLLTNHKWKYGAKRAVKVDDSMKLFDIGLILGLKFSFFTLDSKQSSCEIRYYHGVKDVSSNYEETKFRGFEVLFSYLFSLSQKSKH